LLTAVIKCKILIPQANFYTTTSTKEPFMLCGNTEMVQSYKVTIFLMGLLPLQEKCCGVNDYKDWRRAKFFNGSHSAVPDSCCKEVKPDCGKAIKTPPDNIYTEVSSWWGWDLEILEHSVN